MAHSKSTFVLSIFHKPKNLRSEYGSFNTNETTWRWTTQRSGGSTIEIILACFADFLTQLEKPGRSFNYICHLNAHEMAFDLFQASSPDITLGTIYQIFDSVNDLTGTFNLFAYFSKP
ncbi:hypothetical protein D915_004605 [Fasciola hepatica]|uniref:Uncharacterized protein n=1 Tax=Fasciola hepatica TaxID=6192 RepID=A0A4E0R7F2_FASHE|nr:hypothetical protein D915_004605 [Fasciola hepatica]